MLSQYWVFSKSRFKILRLIFIVGVFSGLGFSVWLHFYGPKPKFFAILFITASLPWSLLASSFTIELLNTIPKPLAISLVGINNAVCFSLLGLNLVFIASILWFLFSKLQQAQPFAFHPRQHAQTFALTTFTILLLGIFNSHYGVGTYLLGLVLIGIPLIWLCTTSYLAGVKLTGKTPTKYRPILNALVAYGMALGIVQLSGISALWHPVLLIFASFLSGWRLIAPASPAN